VSGTTVTASAEWPKTGFFGKLPSRGDFISRHLPKSFLEPWDAWLQAAIAQSRSQLGLSWREYYCTSPIWRFTLGAGVCGPTACAGILMPSVDRVGRYYPLALIAPLVLNASLLTLPTAGAAWFQQAERLALDALDRDVLDLDDFSQQVAILNTPPAAGVAKASAATGDAWYCSLFESLDQSQISPVLANYLLEKAFPQPSLWWTEGSQQITRCLLICNGMPPVAGFVALLAGNWQHWGWNEPSLVGIADLSGEPAAAEEDQA
jgi:type VI secretion system protein ImpM